MPADATGPLVRRRVLLGGAAGLLGSVLAAGGRARDVRLAHAPVRAPFTLGVASGDPSPDGVVLWTRLAPDPLAPDGRGGMPERTVPVRWQVAEDERFHRVVAQGVELARGEDAHSVRVEVEGLRPGADHWYRFRTADDVGPVGHTRTAAAPGSRVDRVALAFASCQNREDGFYPAHAGIAAEDLDLVVFLGDYIYEAAGRDQLGRGHVPTGELASLADYRVRLAQYKTDPDLQAAHAAHPWAVTIDDHEVENNWTEAGSQPDNEPDQDPRVFAARRAAALRAYDEHMPLRRPQRPGGSPGSAASAGMQLHRRLAFGDLLDLHVLDTRRHRSAIDPRVRDDPARAYDDPRRTVLGGEQEAWLRGGLAGSRARWNALAQQVLFCPLRTPAGVEPDSWAGYGPARDRLRDQLARTRNPVVLTGDVHTTYVADVLADVDDPASPTVATELVTTSIATGGSSGGHDGSHPDDARLLAGNPHLRYVDHHRGYVRNVVTPDAWTADIRVVDDVTRRGTPVRTEASFAIADGRPGARRVDPASGELLLALTGAPRTS